MNFYTGEIFAIDKPYGMTSFDALAHVRYVISRKLGIRRIKIDHADTLDPLATGALVLCIGKTTKQIEQLQVHDKEYTCTLQSGATTASYDKEHEVNQTFPIEHIIRRRIDETLKQFVGNIQQTPPTSSACKVDGGRSYNLRCAGGEAVLKPENVRIDEIEVMDFDPTTMLFQLRVVCSKGTYIRTLTRDLERALDSRAYLTALRRTRVGAIKVENSINLDHFKEWLDQQEIGKKHQQMKLSQSKFNLPGEPVALHPHSVYHEIVDGRGEKYLSRATRRDESRLMVLHRKSQTIDMFQKNKKGKPIEGQYLEFCHVLDYFDKGDTFIFNDTKAFSVRLYGTKKKTDAKIEIFLLHELNREIHPWDVLVEPTRKICIGNKLLFDESGTMVAEVIDDATSRRRALRFLYDCPHEEFKRELLALGEAPSPRYILNQYEVPHTDAHDMEDFQTIFAKNEGTVTTAATGLHVSREVMKRMEIKGIHLAYITLRCDLSAFNNIEVEDLTKHKMDSEPMKMDAQACKIVNKAKQEGHRVCAVGTSVVKATETAVGTDGLLKEYDGWTSRFISPSYDLGLADTIIANFYHSTSPLLMETAAFGGYELVMGAYNLAVKHGYKLGYYDGSLLILDD